MRLLLLLVPTLLTLALTAQHPPVRLAAHAETADLRVRVENIQESGGRIWIGIYRSADDFLDREKARLEYYDIAATGDTTLVIHGLEVGREYALGLYYDLDGNDDLSTNWLGLPAEPWAMSRPLRSYLRKPRFHEMAFPFRPGEVIVMRLR